MAAEKRMRKGKAGPILLTLLVLLALLAGLLAWRFREEIRAFRTARQYSTRELEDQLSDNDQTIRDAVDASGDVTVRAPTDEEREALRDGSLTQEELVGRLTGTEPAPDQEPAGNAEQTGETKPAPSAEQQAYQEALSAQIAKVYVLREEYLNALADMESAAKADYKALPASERTAKKLAPLVSSYLAKATKLEKECDGRMDAIVGEMERLIAANNGDMSLTDTVFDSYVKEKSLKKAWYLSRLQEKGLI